MSILGIYSFHKLHILQSNLRQVRRFKSKYSKSLDITTPAVQKYLNYLVFQNECLLSKDQRSAKELKRLYEIKPVVNILVQKIFLQANIDFLNEQKEDAESESVMEMILKETDIYKKRVAELDNQVKSALLDPVLTNSGVVLEIDVNEGEQGSEFAQELVDMYKSYAKHKGWDFSVASLDKSNSSLKHLSALIEGFGAYELMNLEVGKHRRLSPVSSKEGEPSLDLPFHASTVTVSVMPIPNELQYDVPSKDVIIETKEDLDLNNKETRNSSVRITHTPSNTVIECKQHKSNVINEKIAMKKLKAILYEVVSVCNQVDETGKIDVFDKKEVTVRTYDYSQDKVADTREGGKEKFLLQDFLTNGIHLERLHNDLLRHQRYQAVVEDLRKFNLKSNHGKDDVFTLY